VPGTVTCLPSDPIAPAGSNRDQLLSEGECSCIWL
jgi:hypothetical protein